MNARLKPTLIQILIMLFVVITILAVYVSIPSVILNGSLQSIDEETKFEILRFFKAQQTQNFRSVGLGAIIVSGAAIIVSICSSYILKSMDIREQLVKKHAEQIQQQITEEGTQLQDIRRARVRAKQNLKDWKKQCDTVQELCSTAWKKTEDEIFQEQEKIRKLQEYYDAKLSSMNTALVESFDLLAELDEIAAKFATIMSKSPSQKNLSKIRREHGDRVADSIKANNMKISNKLQSLREDITKLRNTS